MLDELARARSTQCRGYRKGHEGAHGLFFRRSIEFFEDHDILITPAAAVGAGFPHEDVYPRSIDGMDLHG